MNEEWEISDFPSHSTQKCVSQQHQPYGPQQKIEAVGDVTVEDSLSQAEAEDMFRSHLSRHKAVRRLKRWQRFRSHRGLGFRLTRHWRSWRQRAQRLCLLGHRWSRRGQRYNLYDKQRRIKRYQQSPYTEREEDSNDERLTEPERGTDVHPLLKTISYACLAMFHYKCTILLKSTSWREFPPLSLQWDFQLHRLIVYNVFVLSDKHINGCSLDKQEDRGRREMEVKPVELALTEEHMSCVTGVYRDTEDGLSSLSLTFTLVRYFMPS